MRYDPSAASFSRRLQAEITSRGVIDVLRHGVKHGKHELILFYGTPSPAMRRRPRQFAANRFSIIPASFGIAATRQCGHWTCA